MKAKKVLPLLIAGLISGTSIYAQDQRQEIVNAVTDYVDAFYYGDTAKLNRSVSVQAAKYGYYRKKGGNTYEGEPMSFQQMLDYASSIKKKGPNPKVETFPKQILVLDQQDQTASAKLTAWWGTDYILLAKVNNKWVITHVLWQSSE